MRLVFLLCGCRVGLPHGGSGFTKAVQQPSWTHSKWHQRGPQVSAVMLLPASNTQPKTLSYSLCSYLWVSTAQSPRRLFLSTSPETTWSCEALLM